MKTFLRLGIAFTFSCGALGCSYPCGWSTTETDRTPTKGVAMSCGSSTYPVIARYENAVSATDAGASLLSVAFITVGFATDERLNFSAALADGTYPIDVGSVWPTTRATGSFAFARSRDVPLADIEPFDSREYVSTIDFELDALLTDSNCALKTEGALHLVQSGPLLECTRGKLGGSH